MRSGESLTLRISELPWLEAVPADYSKRLNALGIGDTNIGAALQELAGFRLDFTRLVKLGGKLKSRQDAGVDLRPLTEVVVGIVSNGTVDFLAQAMRATGLRYGLNLNVIFGDFGQPFHEAISPQSTVNTARPQLVLLAIDHRGLPVTAHPGSKTDEAAQAALSYIRTLRDGLARESGARIIVQTIPQPAEPMFGSFDRRVSGSWAQIIASINIGIQQMAQETGDIVLDLEGLANTVGLASWHDHGAWFGAKIPFALTQLPIVADNVVRIINAWRGNSRKVLVLDLDNTIWGGVIGDDGLDGISLGKGDGLGEAYLAVQEMAKQYSHRGIVLAVCSKNEDANAREPFEKHPEMLLRLTDIGAFVANWNDKASNIVAISKALELGLESFVFMDDNPVEREQVRRALPQVAVPELPDDPALYVPTIMHAGYFEAIAFTAEDMQRAEYYASRLKRDQLRVEGQSIDDYLVSLEMTMTARPFSIVDMTRVTQLINKTNQFNLTTVRCDEARVRSWMNSPDTVTMQVRVADKFGDNGIIGVVVAERKDDVWTIPIWLMSCRVLNRRVEEGVLDCLVEILRPGGGRKLAGLYIPSAKNALVKDHYKKLGFANVGCRDDGTTEWELELAGYKSASPPFRYL